MRLELNSELLLNLELKKTPLNSVLLLNYICSFEKYTEEAAQFRLNYTNTN